MIIIKLKFQFGRKILFFFLSLECSKEWWNGFFEITKAVQCVERIRNIWLCFFFFLSTKFSIIFFLFYFSHFRFLDLFLRFIVFFILYSFDFFSLRKSIKLDCLFSIRKHRVLWDLLRRKNWTKRIDLKWKWELFFEFRNHKKFDIRIFFFIVFLIWTNRKRLPVLLDCLAIDRYVDHMMLDGMASYDHLDNLDRTFHHIWRF